MTEPGTRIKSGPPKVSRDLLLDVLLTHPIKGIQDTIALPIDFQSEADNSESKCGYKWSIYVPNIRPGLTIKLRLPLF